MQNRLLLLITAAILMLINVNLVQAISPNMSCADDSFIQTIKDDVNIVIKATEGLSATDKVTWIEAILKTKEIRRKYQDLPSIAQGCENMLRFAIMLFGEYEDGLFLGLASLDDPANSKTYSSLFAEKTAKVTKLGKEILNSEINGLAVQATSEATKTSDGLSFTGQGNKLLGPFNLPSGLYKFTITTTIKGDTLVALGTKVSGDCEFILQAITDGSNRAETTIRSRGCRITLEMSSSQSSSTWTAAFEELK
jgi:hypothetical protein